MKVQASTAWMEPKQTNKKYTTRQLDETRQQQIKKNYTEYEIKNKNKKLKKEYFVSVYINTMQHAWSQPEHKMYFLTRRKYISYII